MKNLIKHLLAYRKDHLSDEHKKSSPDKSDELYNKLGNKLIKKL